MAPEFMPLWLNSDLDDIETDVVKQSANELCALSSNNVNEIQNLRYQHGKRLTGNNDSVIHNNPTFPEEIDMGKFKSALQTDVFAGPMLKILELDELPLDNAKARNLLLQSSQYYWVMKVFYITFGICQLKEKYQKEM